MFVTSAIVVLLLSVGLIILGKLLVVDEERVIMEKLSKAPIANVFSVLDIEYNKAEIILKNHNIIIAGSNTIEDVSRKNQKSPEDILEIIIQ